MERFIHQAAGEGTRILAFPEMCITGYWHVIDLSAEEAAEPIDDSPSLARIARLAQSYDGHWRGAD
jgi:predicted amidohydrolase